MQNSISNNVQIGGAHRLLVWTAIASSLDDPNWPIRQFQPISRLGQILAVTVPYEIAKQLEIKDGYRFI